MNRRDFMATTTAIALAPAFGETRERLVGFGKCGTDQTINETFAIDKWNGKEWVDTYERRTWWLRNGRRNEARYFLSVSDIQFLNRF